MQSGLTCFAEGTEKRERAFKQSQFKWMGPVVTPFEFDADFCVLSLLATKLRIRFAEHRDELRSHDAVLGIHRNGK